MRLDPGKSRPHVECRLDTFFNGQTTQSLQFSLPRCRAARAASRSMSILEIAFHRSRHLPSPRAIFASHGCLFSPASYQPSRHSAIENLMVRERFSRINGGEAWHRRKKGGGADRRTPRPAPMRLPGTSILSHRRTAGITQRAGKRELAIPASCMTPWFDDIEAWIRPGQWGNFNKNLQLGILSGSLHLLTRQTF